MKFILEIDTDNAAFDDRNAELARLLRFAAAKLDNGDESFKLMDVNGNGVGSAELVDNKFIAVRANDEEIRDEFGRTYLLADGEATGLTATNHSTIRSEEWKLGYHDGLNDRPYTDDPDDTDSDYCDGYAQGESERERQ